MSKQTLIIEKGASGKPITHSEFYVEDLIGCCNDENISRSYEAGYKQHLLYKPANTIVLQFFHSIELRPKAEGILQAIEKSYGNIY